MLEIQSAVQQNPNSLAVIVTVTVVITWLTTSASDPMTRGVTTVLAALLAFLAAAAGLALFTE